jgi:P4 family phage/plasmid primase-like protien
MSKQPGTIEFEHFGMSKQRPPAIGRGIVKAAEAEGIFYTYDQRSEDFYRWDGKKWTIQLKDRMEQRAYQFDEFDHCSAARASETVRYMKAMVGKDDIEWDSLPNGVIPLEAGLLNFMKERPEVEEHDKELHYTYNLPIEYDNEATSPIWEEALERWFRGAEDAEQRKAALQEYMGYSLLAHARYKKALMLVGESNTGKSRVEAAMRMLVGQKLCTSVRLEAFNTSRFQFGLEDLLGKQLNFISEPSKGDLLNDGMFKQVVSGSDAVTVHRKNQKGVTTVLRAKHIIATNVMPIIKDESEGTWNRLLIVPFDNVIPKDEQDPLFDEKLRAELPGLLNWCIEGAKRLVANRGQFTHVPSGEQRAQEHKDESNPLTPLLEDDLVSDPLSTVSSGEVTKFINKQKKGSPYHFKQVERWLEELGFEPMKRLDEAGKDTRANANDPLTGKRVKCKRYQGLRLKLQNSWS